MAIIGRKKQIVKRMIEKGKKFVGDKLKDRAKEREKNNFGVK